MALRAEASVRSRDAFEGLHVVDRQRLHDLAGALKDNAYARWIAKHDVEVLVGVLLRRLTGADDNLRAVIDRLRNIDLSQDVGTISIAVLREISTPTAAIDSSRSGIAATPSQNSGEPRR